MFLTQANNSVATISFVTPEDLAIRDRKIERLEQLLEAYVSS